MTISLINKCAVTLRPKMTSQNILVLIFLLPLIHRNQAEATQSQLQPQTSAYHSEAPISHYETPSKIERKQDEQSNVSPVDETSSYSAYAHNQPQSSYHESNVPFEIPYAPVSGHGHHQAMGIFGPDQVDSFWQQFERKFNAPGGLFDKARENDKSASHEPAQDDYRSHQSEPSNGDYSRDHHHHQHHHDQPREQDEHAPTRTTDMSKLDYDSRNPVYIGQETNDQRTERSKIDHHQQHHDESPAQKRRHYELHQKLLEQHKQNVMQRLAHSPHSLGTPNYRSYHSEGPQGYHHSYHTSHRYNSADPANNYNRNKNTGFNLTPANDGLGENGETGDPSLALHESRHVMGFRSPEHHMPHWPIMNPDHWHDVRQVPATNPYFTHHANRMSETATTSNGKNGANVSNKANQEDSPVEVRSQRRRKDLSSNNSAATNTGNYSHDPSRLSHESNNIFKFYAYEKINNNPPHIESFIRNPFL